MRPCTAEAPLYASALPLSGSRCIGTCILMLHVQTHKTLICGTPTTHRAGTTVKRSQVAQDTAHAHQKPRGHGDEQEPSGPAHRTRKASHRAGTPVNRSQVARDTGQAKQHTERAHR